MAWTIFSVASLGFQPVCIKGVVNFNCTTLICPPVFCYDGQDRAVCKAAEWKNFVKRHLSVDFNGLGNLSVIYSNPCSQYNSLHW